ncbi:MAG: YeeE/YedE thiosulfate transporter family protein, partial [Thermodesulfovibrio sp.]
MMSSSNKAWNPYLTGALSGLVSILSVWISGHFLGASTTFVRMAGAIESLFLPKRVEEMDYFSAFPPQIDWQLMFLAGIFIGSLVAAVISKDFNIRW